MAKQAKLVLVPGGRLGRILELLSDVERAIPELTGPEALEVVAEAARLGARASGRIAVLEALTAAFAAPVAPDSGPDEGLSLPEAARVMGEPPETFRRRLEHRKALLRRPGERRLRYSRSELERIRRDRLAGNGLR